MNSATDWEAQHRQTLLESRATLERSASSVARSQRIAAETEQVGTEVVAELGEQRETLLRAKRRLSQTDQELTKTQKVLRTMTRRVLTNKFILVLIIILEVGILAAVVYLKFFRK
ncbi:vesicle transport through interaction with t-SNAREs homolog 1B [Neodiprion pinetum]|uniref:Vesicle transport through interaction with t-SNAREs homolog 1B n=1 Tax=Neodiprion lecontei TaxID=441921 RepID=A0A6J0BZ63_NEOLC|nr:vesicle transport through interaction with t-SNAREs homolog 1B [Neodiprion lecontei]XP_046419653.1 vesicle transport through interaction with t-SNAREs homolog 1B [Neodiprion fabricii]XP_046480008.1 vesicle transport through interaction with t-SNAREs homolog 1B [Neodiprion pinetum]XP_046614132.1 vesicle transport through interaction with t-SNAREs homolog 1B [Neodiprion virginianus]